MNPDDVIMSPARARERAMRTDLSADDLLPDDTRLWAALQHAGGETWGGCVYDVKAVTELLKSAQRKD